MTPSAASYERQQQLLLMAESERRKKAYPLAYAKLWDRKAPRTSQRRAIALDSSRGPNGRLPRLTLVLGGNRTGKSEAMAQWAIAQAAGRDAFIEERRGRVEWVRQWLAINGLPEESVPLGPGRVWVGSPVFASSREQIRPKLKRYAPGGTRYICWEQPQEAEMRLPGSNGETGVLVSKAYRQFDQDRQSWEGASLRAMAFDEQPNNYDNLQAALARLIDVGGRAMMALTPLRGKADWLYQEIVRKAPEWLRIAKLHGKDNPHIDQLARAEILGMFSAWQRAARDLGDFTDPSGAVYPFDRAIHEIQPFEPPEHWTRFHGTDWGSRNAHMLWAAEVRESYTLMSGVTLRTGDLVVYREFAFRRRLSEPPMDAAKLIEVGQKLEEGTPEGDGRCSIYRIADGAEPDSIDEASRMGWAMAAADKGRGSISVGISHVEALLRAYDPVSGEPVRPRLYVTSDCPVLIEEMEGLRYAEERAGQDAYVDPMCPDHGPDTLRYVVRYRHDEWGSMAA